MVWKCELDGDCCELFAPYSLGYKCPMLAQDRTCTCYGTRAPICRVNSFDVPVDKDEYLIARCKFIHSLKKWKDECGETESVKYILEKIAKSGLR